MYVYIYIYIYICICIFFFVAAAHIPNPSCSEATKAVVHNLKMLLVQSQLRIYPTSNLHIPQHVI